MIKKTVLLIALVMIARMLVIAQIPQGMPPRDGAGHTPMMENPVQTDSWTVTVNDMDPSCRERITSVCQAVQDRSSSRGVLGDILKFAGFAGLSSIIDYATNEVFNLIKYRKVQKQNWMNMIQNECFYTDSLSSIQALKDFYKKPSRCSALDPSDINFDGITIQGIRNGVQMLYISCHIDTTRLEHLVNHSKFYLAVDSICFSPYMCHLPNLAANGIRSTQRANNKDKEHAKKSRKKTEKTRDNSFSYVERNHLTIGMELSLYSSWINEATFIQQNFNRDR